MNKFFDKLPFKLLAEKIPAEARAKFPLLDKVIPFTNHIACGVALLLLLLVVSGGGGSSQSAKAQSAGGSSSGSTGTSSNSQAIRENPESDFEVILTEDNEGVVISKYVGTSKTVRIPATIQGMPVRVIGFSAFRGNKDVTSVVIPEGVFRIEANYYSNIATGAWSSEGAFAGCTSLSSVTLPSTLTDIGAGVFINCSTLQTITLPANLTEIGAYVFQNSGLTAFPNWPTGLTDIPFHGFENSKLRGRVVILEGVTIIDNYAFSKNPGITSVTLPSTIKEIGNYAFSGCPNIDLASQAAIRNAGYEGGFR